MRHLVCPWIRACVPVRAYAVTRTRMASLVQRVDRPPAQTHHGYDLHPVQALRIHLVALLPVVLRAGECNAVHLVLRGQLTVLVTVV